ncbi:E3 ubiquitin-protein ligase XBOS31 [Actinidia chinensis var. chinensis]|uniref:E3 ubiquitin-protein ligase XBOS31 n=1 Tax=Actinidia chinensis var. chinensis TaxID=1590841 RepID=A0A2R6RNF1_ACTCC|nr:E3 ubiquitin-protein ligase XBOS31 [Actinidia chinensis var. chinensis]
MMLCANNTRVVVPHNEILIHPLGGSPTLHQRNPTLTQTHTHKFKILYQKNQIHNKQRIRFSCSSARPDVVEVDGNNNSSSLTSSTSTTEWVEFARNVSGEWDGYGADFSSQGKPIELPESVVPEAYREWEVKVYDWQTQCPTLAQTDNLVLFYKLIKLLPTVGCEADAATRYFMDDRKVGGADNSASAFAYQSSGCYAAVWVMKDHATYRLLELEHCLMDPRNRESRVRIIQVVLVEKCKLTLKNVKVFCEQWYGPFRNGEQLGGCAIRDSAFASTDALKSSEVTGVWQGLHSVASFLNPQTNFIQELQDDSVRKSVRDEHNLVLLPKQLWSSLKEKEDGETCCEVGWLLDQGNAITSKCIFSPDAGIKEITIARETAATAQ